MYRKNKFGGLWRLKFTRSVKSHNTYITTHKKLKGPQKQATKIFTKPTQDTKIKLSTHKKDYNSSKELEE